MIVFQKKNVFLHQNHNWLKSLFSMDNTFLQQLEFNGHLRTAKEICSRYPDYADITKIGVDSVYFSSGKPAVLILNVPTFDDDNLKKIAKIQHNAWNYQRVLLLYVTSETEIRIYNCFEKPINIKANREEDKQLESLQLAKFSVKEDLSTLKDLFSRINVDSGTIWTRDSEIKKKIQKDKRVDAYLIKSMCQAAQKLENKGLPLKVIHSLLIRSLFILFLEDKGASKKAGLYESIMSGAKDFFDILKNKKATYQLFKQLQDQFNGNITSLENEEENLVTEEHLEVIRDCFLDGDFSHQQLFERDRLFNFEIIHIGLISEIYENFLGEYRHKKGQFYTPFSLADMILSEVLPTSNGECNYPFLDMTCGSGVFLVEGYKRLIGRWKRDHVGEKISFDTLVSLLKNNVYGIEIDETAIRVTAFSLYLTLIDQLDPKILWNSRKHRLPYLIYDPDDKSLDGKQGNNLWRRNTISEVDTNNFPKVKLLVGNPPYGTNNLEPEIKQYCQQEKFASEYVLPFMHKATKFCPTGEIALIFTSKVLFNTGGGYAKFRKWFFNENTVRRIDNLSIFRKAQKTYGGSLFSSANCPVCVAYYTAQKTEKQSTLLYYSPKTFIKSNLIDGLVIDDSDVKLLPMSECQKPQTTIWKVASWGNNYGYRLIERVSQKTLKIFFKENNWIYGRGLNADSKKQDFIPNRIIGTGHIARYFTNLSEAKSDETKKYRNVPSGLFEPPIVVFKQGQHNGEIASSLFMEKVYFTTTANALNCDNIDDKKILVTYLNSRLAKYFLFLTTSSWGVEREQIYLNEVLNLPSPFDGLTSNSKKKIIDYFDQIYKFSGEILTNESQIKKLEANAETEFEQAFGLTEKDITYINDTLDFNFGIFQKGKNAKGYNRVLPTESKQYAETMLKSLSKLLTGTNLTPKITTFEGSSNDPLLLIVLELNSSIMSVEEGTMTEFKDVLQKIDSYLWKRQSESVYMRRTLTYYEDSHVYLIKPNQKRFWSRMQAYDDANAIINDIMNM